MRRQKATIAAGTPFAKAAYFGKISFDRTLKTGNK